MCIILLQEQGGTRALLLLLHHQVDPGEPRPRRPVAGGPWSAAALEGSSQHSHRIGRLAAAAGSQVPTARQHQYVWKQPGRHPATGPEGHKGRCKAPRRKLSHVHKTAGTREGQRSNQAGHRGDWDMWGLKNKVADGSKGHHLPRPHHYHSITTTSSSSTTIKTYFCFKLCLLCWLAF